MIFELFYKFIELVVLLVQELGYIGIFLGMTLESSFVPFPSEVILIPAGALAATGQMSLFWVFAYGLLGCIAGALINYSLALYLGRPSVNYLVSKYGKVFLLNEKNLKKTDLFFHKHGEVTTFVGRLIPMARQLISVPAGFSRMNLPKFIFYTALGAGIWTAILVYVGFIFGNNLDWLHANKNMLTAILLTGSLIIAGSYLVYARKIKN